jgi:hypothetical protein
VLSAACRSGTADWCHSGPQGNFSARGHYLDRLRRYVYGTTIVAISASLEYGDIQLYEYGQDRTSRSEQIPLQTQPIIRPILAGVPSWGYTDKGQIPSKHTDGGSNPSRGTSVLSQDIVDTCRKTFWTGQRPPRGW